MFFTREHFKKYLTDQEADTIAKVANEIVDVNGIVVYGNAYQDDSCNNFSTERSKGDTHVMIGIGLSEMGLFKSMGDIKKAKPTETELVRVMESRNKMLERENKTLRRGEGE